MTSEWADTPWAGEVPTQTSGNVVRMLPAKAATGWEPIYSPDRLVASTTRNPLRRMRDEQALYWNHPWIRVAESTVTRRVAGLPWHIEDGDSDEEVDDQGNNPTLKAVQALLEKPQAALAPRDRQPGIATWKNLIKITSRHMGLCGMTHWYLDGLRDGVPNALLYVNPARLYPVTGTNGSLLAWSLDPKDDDGRGGQLFPVDAFLTFYLDPPDAGGLASGLVQAAWLKAQITLRGDNHYLSSLYAGGALSGMVSPKEGAMQPEQYEVVARELRNIQEAPDSARRLAVLRGPVDFHQTSQTAQELDLSGYSAMTRSDILTVWGVPDSQTGIPAPAGLNSGGAKEADEPILMQGAVHDRVDIIRETVQLQLLDRWLTVGQSPQLVIEEPTYDDRTPAFNLAGLAKELPLTRNQRLALVGEDPLPEYGPDGEPLGLAIDLPMTLVTVGQGEEPDRLRVGRFNSAPQPQTTPMVLPPIMPPALPANVPSFGKAGGLPRAAVLRRFEPLVRKAVSAFLAEQKRDIAAKVREKGDHISRKGVSDYRVWFDQKKWDAKLAEALRQGVAGISTLVATKVQGQLGQPAKAFEDTVAKLILRTVGRRIAGINETTREGIGAIIAEGFAQGLAPAQVADLIEEAAAFDDARAELIARTESALVYNEAAIESFREYGVERVEAIDGDEDEECAERNGQVFTVDEALDIQDHPNGTLDWSPVFA